VLVMTMDAAYRIDDKAAAIPDAGWDDRDLAGGGDHYAETLIRRILSAANPGHAARSVYQSMKADGRCAHALA